MAIIVCLRIATPLMWIDKAHDLGGVPLMELIAEHTHTCYRGSRDVRHDWGCGQCPACALRANGWEKYSADAARLRVLPPWRLKSTLGERICLSIL